VPTRVFIAEDEPLLAVGLRKCLVLDGFEIAGCVGSVKSALTLLDEIDCDIALLDVNLRGELVTPVADVLRQRERPIVFMSGYSRTDLPDLFRDFPVLSKPFDTNELVALIRQSLERRNVT
jgi:DNA-binding response OmpR family regulator